MSDVKNRLRSTEVPWQVSPSEEIIGFAGKESEAVIRILAFFGPKTLEDTRQQLIKEYGSDVPDDLWNRAGYKSVSVSFDSVLVFCMWPPQLPYGLLDEKNYDFSGIELHYNSSISFSEWSSKFDRQWITSGVCPDPRFYEVLDSELMLKLGIRSPAVRHWILLGHDVYFEILGKSFQHEVEQDSA
ncbi:MAG: hypothetical protein DME76_08495 [Verrucomicrobia bacterium]|nr:MAG: hypothetical protein DME76_08495 [Verrucomicrobiota bacterium]